MYQKKHKSLHIQDECVTTRKPMTRFQKFMKRWKKHVFKYMFKTIEVFWQIIQVVATLGGLIVLALEILGLR